MCVCVCVGGGGGGSDYITSVVNEWAMVML